MILRFSIFGNHYYFTFKFLGLSLSLISIFCYLGLWQYHRAEEKRILIQAYQERPLQAPLHFDDLFKATFDSRFYTVSLKGHFDNQHSIFLDNRTLDGQIGYEVYTPFLVENKTNQAVLIDRGFIPATQNRKELPTLQNIKPAVSLKGVVNLPPRYFVLGDMTDHPDSPFPLRIQYLNLAELAPRLKLKLAPYIIWLDPHDSYGFKRSWKVTFMGPEKHILYAVQWFAFALSLLVLSVVLNFHRVKK